MKMMYRCMAFWTIIFAAMFYVGHMISASLLFLGLTGFLLTIGFLNISERMGVYIFGALLTVFFVGFTYYTTFIMQMGGGGH